MAPRRAPRVRRQAGVLDTGRARAPDGSGGSCRSARGSASAAPAPNWRRSRLRSEEHTSELQSLMRISYAVFCLKKKKQKQKDKNNQRPLTVTHNHNTDVARDI